LATDEQTDFEALVRRQTRFVFRVAYAVLLNAADAEDVAQETFLKLFRNGGWNHLENERAFLARVTWRLAVDHRRGALSRANIVEPIAVDISSAEPSPEETLTDANRDANLHAMIDALPEELRVPLVLSAMNEISSRDIGRILSIPEGTVRTRLQRARQLLHKKLLAIEESGHA
jgi:RNA polymerase sigma-70 factor, ECF subfamily